MDSLEVRELLCRARDASQRVDAWRRRINRARESTGLRARSLDRSRSGAFLDPMRFSDSVLDMEAAMPAEVREARRLRAEAERIVARISREVGTLHASIVRRRFLDGEPWGEVARGACLPRDACEELAEWAFEQIADEGDR